MRDIETIIFYLKHEGNVTSIKKQTASFLRRKLKKSLHNGQNSDRMNNFCFQKSEKTYK
jgi:hypothetical protein